MLKIVDDKPKAEPPRMMSRDDRRIIFAKLSDVYVDEKVGYAQGWSDHRVATDLGVPRKWVEDIRKENFGDVAINEDMEQFRREAEALLAEAREKLDAIRHLQNTMQGMVDALENSRKSEADLRDKLNKLSKLAHQVSALIPGAA